jgi:ABC-type branched-subunit amino acid transport system ATPase component
VALLQVEKLRKSFGGLMAVKDLSFSRGSQGEIVGLIGPNGAGKSTVFNLIMGVAQARSGHGALQRARHHPLADVQDRGTRGSHGVFQIARYFPRKTVYENVEISAIPNEIFVASRRSYGQDPRELCPHGAVHQRTLSRRRSMHLSFGSCRGCSPQGGLRTSRISSGHRHGPRTLIIR